ncbi:MAG: hypothetical protein BWY98_01142 [Tenericutes bacterium ADurb.BinA155]|nr:MAG: hypothetical protein BWY98_01142 [Tenericutes bacterium ADurb.BinA155]
MVASFRISQRTATISSRFRRRIASRNRPYLKAKPSPKLKRLESSRLKWRSRVATICPLRPISTSLRSAMAGSFNSQVVRCWLLALSPVTKPAIVCSPAWLVAASWRAIPGPSIMAIAFRISKKAATTICISKPWAEKMAISIRP